MFRFTGSIIPPEQLTNPRLIQFLIAPNSRANIQCRAKATYMEGGDALFHSSGRWGPDCWPGIAKDSKGKQEEGPGHAGRVDRRDVSKNPSMKVILDLVVCFLGCGADQARSIRFYCTCTLASRKSVSVPLSSQAIDSFIPRL